MERPPGISHSLVLERPIVVVTSIRPLQPGVFSANLRFMIGAGNDQPVEFRVVNEHAAFDGRVMLGHVTLTVQHDTSNQAIDLLTTELGLSP